MRGGGRDGRAPLRWALSGLYGIIGLVHLVATERFLPIMPSWVPAPLLVVILTGLCEIAGAVALFLPPLQRAAGLAFALYAICVVPANLKQAFEHIDMPPIPDSWWYHGPRLLLQPVLVWIALYAVHLIDWPLRRRRGERDDPSRSG